MVSSLKSVKHLHLLLPVIDPEMGHLETALHVTAQQLQQNHLDAKPSCSLETPNYFFLFL